MSYIHILRPWQWIKNLLILIPCLLNKPFSQESFFDSLTIFFVFSLFVSGNYILNDISDIEIDKLHPKKQFRPLPSGKIKLNFAKAYSALLIIPSLLYVNSFDPKLLIYFFLYLLVANLYTHYLKFIFLINSFSISTFFLIRLLIGGEVSNVNISIYLSTYIFFSSFFIAVLKKNSIINTPGLKEGKYFETLKQENKTISSEKLSLTSLFFSNLTLIIWSIVTIEQISIQKIFSILVFLFLYFLLTLMLHENSKKGDLEDFVLGFVKDKNLLLFSFLLILSFYYFYFI